MLTIRTVHSYTVSGKQKKIRRLMEKFTNDRDEFIRRIKLDLCEYDHSETDKHMFTYTEIPFHLPYAFSYNWSINDKNSKYTLKRKEWNATLDNARFGNGIYNLDRISIIEKEILVNPKDEIFLKSIKWEKIKKVQFTGIILDGIYCELQMKENDDSINWNVDEEMNNELTKLIYRIRNWTRDLT